MANVSGFSVTSKIILGESFRVRAEHLQYIGRRKNFSLTLNTQYDRFNVTTYNTYKQDGLYKQQFFLADAKAQYSSYRNSSFGIGQRFEWIYYKPAFNSSFQFKGSNNFLTTYFFITHNTLDKSIYPGKGIKINSSFEWVSTQNPNINFYQTEDNIILENLIIDFRINGDWVPWSYLSDGSKRLFYLISETISLSQGVLLIEEPEFGVHPHKLHHILDFLKEQSRNKQIIISTHSPLALDVLDENELDRIIIAKYEKGSRFNHLTQDQIDTAKRYMNEVGELSYYWLHSDLDV